MARQRKPDNDDDASKQLSIVPSMDLSRPDQWELLKHRAEEWSKSTIIPKEYQNNPANCIVVFEIAARLGWPTLQVMQSIHVINGRPGWYSQAIIAMVNNSGKFKGMLKFKIHGEGMQRRCVAYAIERATGELVEGTPITMEMAKMEGWIDRNPKWRSMPEHMLRWRAASFFGRQYIPERLLGLPSVEELGDIIDVTPEKPGSAPAGVAGAKQLFADQQPQAPTPG